MGKSIAIIGAGSVGRAIGKGLREAGWRIGSVVCRSEAAAREAVRAIGGGKPHGGLTRLVLNSDIALISVPAKDVMGVAEQLGAMGGEEWRGKGILHTCETRDHSVLGVLASHGALTASVHPLQVFDRRQTASLQGAFFGIEGGEAALRIARGIVRDLGGTAVRLNRVRCGLYDVALRFAKNDVPLLVSASAKILATLGFSGRQAAMVAIQLARQSLLNFERYGNTGRAASNGQRIEVALFDTQKQALREFSAEYANVYSALRMKTTRTKAMDLGRNSWQH